MASAFHVGWACSVRSAFGLAAAVMSPVFTALMSSWGYVTSNLVLGCVALIAGLAASILVRFPEVHLAEPAVDTAIESTNPSVVEALKALFPKSMF